LNRWLDNIVADPAPLSPDKVVSDKPADAVDSCWGLSGNKIVEPATTDPNTQCNRLYPYFSQPQIEAGRGLTRDVLKCTLKPINFADYRVAFTPAEQSQLRSFSRTAFAITRSPASASSHYGVRTCWSIDARGGAVSKRREMQSAILASPERRRLLAITGG
jgi:hypothetical protein